ncbi:MAG: NUDIX hydrolase [Patescibacteria group bacterium]
MQDQQYTLQNSELIFSEYFKIRRNTYLTPENKNKTYHVLDTPEAAIVLAITKDKQVVLVKQFRGGAADFVVELPAGRVEKGETSIEGAKRELLEETGYDGDLEFICTMSKGHSNSGLLQVFFCDNAYLKQAPEHTDFEQGMEVILQPLKEFINDLMNSDLVQNKPAAFAALYKKNIHN